MKNRFLTIVMAISSAIVLTACFSENAVEDESDGASLIINTEESEESEDDEEAKVDTSNGRYIQPLSVVLDVNDPEDGEYSVSFRSSDINLEANEMSFTVYSADSYDAIDINMLQIGDTLYYDGSDMVVESIEDRSGDLYINGGLDAGGCELRADDDGTYVAHTFDDYTTYSEIGKLSIPISETIEISDSINNPNSPVTAGYEEIEDYIEGLEEWSSSFTQFNTTVEIRGGKVVAITRIWTP